MPLVRPAVIWVLQNAFSKILIARQAGHNATLTQAAWPVGRGLTRDEKKGGSQGQCIEIYKWSLRSSINKPMSRRIALPAIFLVLIYGAYAQQPSTKVSRSRPQSSASVVEIENRAQQRKAAVFRAHTIAERILAFQDVKTKALALAHLADLLWADDESYARQSLSKALEVLPAQDSSSQLKSKLTTRETASLRRQIISRIAKRDAGWAKCLIALC